MTPRNEPIAIVGIGCRLPGGADSPEAFWRLLTEGVDAIGEIPASRMPVDVLYDTRPATPGRINTRWGGFLEGVERFDASFFGMSPREAEWLDPQQRLLLETTWEALEAGGQVSARLRGTCTGVFVGMWLNEYETRMFRDPAAIDFYMTTGTGRYAASGRLSHIFGWNGPSMTLDCACSSSLVAVHLACQSLRSGECDLAIAAGSNVLLEPSITIAYSQSRMMAPDGRCKFGDARANGYVRSDGAAVLVLKRLSEAVAAGDPITAVIVGSAVNNDGDSSGSFGTPGAAGQEDLLRKAYRNAGVAPGSVWYAEAHGTGTRAGDPVELQALGAVLGEGRPAERPLVVGSVKTNIGHTEGAAGVAGLIKAALVVQHRLVPRSLHLKTPNPDIPWERLPVVVPQAEVPWPGGDAAPVAGVSSFGIAGTNAHVVVRAFEPEPRPAGAPAPEEPRLLPLSASSPEALTALARAWLERDATGGFGDASLRDLAYTSGARRTHLDERLALVASDRTELRAGLQSFLAGERRRGVSFGRVAPEGRDRVVFVFPGQGSQWLGMGRELLDREPAFRASMEACDRAVRAAAGWSVLDEIWARPEASRLEDISVVQPTLFSMQVALAALWKARGVTPSAIVGHSMGEVAAAHVAGGLSLEDAALVICRRSELMKRVSGKGAMAVVELSFEAAHQAVQPFHGRLSVAVSNSSRSTVVSGDVDAVDELIGQLESRGVFARRVKVDVASHSPHMDPLTGELLARLQGLRPTPETVPLHSTVLAARIGGPQLGAAYWVRNLREPVLFSKVVRALAKEGHGYFLEVSPHPVLVPAVQQELDAMGSSATALGSLVREEDDRISLLDALGQLYAHGYEVDWQGRDPEGRLVGLPAYPWQRERLWFEGPAWDKAAPLAGAAPAKGETEPKEDTVGAGLFEVAWRESASSPPPSAATDRPWLVLTDRRGVGRALADHLKGQGLAVESLEWEPALDAAEAWTRVSKDRWGGPWSRWAGIVHLWSLDAPDFASAPGEALGQTAERDSLGVIGLVRTLAALEGAAAPRLYVVTGGSQAVTDLAEVTSPGAGLLWGLGRVIDAEQPELRCTNIDLEGGAGPTAAIVLAAELGAKSADNQVAFRKGRRYVPRLLSHGALGGAAYLRPRWRSVGPAEGQPYRAVARHPGAAEGLALESMVRRPPGAGQVEVEVVASGLNFMNALAVLGACPGYDRGVGPLGGDCAGRVVAVGEGVPGVRPGDAVMGAVLDSLATHVVTDARLLARIPAGLDFEQAATVPIAFLTAYYALHALARLGQGETVLIHAATGGVGLAALQVARWLGAKVVGSAGSPAKRQLLQSLGVETIVDSRSPDFGDQLLEATGGRRVDVVLNSLAGDFVERGLSILAPGGRFVELGKRDIQAGRALDLGLLRDGRSFFAVDLDRMIRERPDAVGALLVEVRDLVEGGAFRPLPHEAFPASRAAEALRTLAEARHVGKLVIRLDDREAQVEHPGLDRERLRGGTCLVTGGLGALGLLTARWLVDAGLRSIVLVSRRPPEGFAATEIEALRAAGATVRVMSADVSDRAGVEHLLGTIDREMPPLVGVVHAAGILDDATLVNLAPDQFRRVLAGKAFGAAHLHELTATRPLALFLLYSSIAPLIGSGGQASYAAANAFLDSLAAFRRARGLAATSIDWGPWGGAGLAAADEKRGARLADRGLPSLDPVTALAMLEHILADAPAHAVAAHFDWGRFRQATPDVARWPFFSDVAQAGEAAPAAESVRELALRVRAGRERVGLIEEEVRGSVARVLRQNVARIDVAKPFRSLGLDSLMGLELRTQLERRFEIPVPATLVWNYPNVSALARELARRAEIPLDGEAAPDTAQGDEISTPAPAPDLEAMLAQIEQLSDEEARRLLAEDADASR